MLMQMRKTENKQLNFIHLMSAKWCDLNEMSKHGKRSRSTLS